MNKFTYYRHNTLGFFYRQNDQKIQGFNLPNAAGKKGWIDCFPFTDQGGIASVATKVGVRDLPSLARHKSEYGFNKAKNSTGADISISA